MANTSRNINLPDSQEKASLGRYLYKSISKLLFKKSISNPLLFVPICLFTAASYNSTMQISKSFSWMLGYLRRTILRQSSNTFKCLWNIRINLTTKSCKSTFSKRKNISAIIFSKTFSTSFKKASSSGPIYVYQDFTKSLTNWSTNLFSTTWNGFGNTLKFSTVLSNLVWAIEFVSAPAPET